MEQVPNERLGVALSGGGADVSETPSDQYQWPGAQPACSNDYVLPIVLAEIGRFGAGLSVLDLGCGNGNVAFRIAELGHRVVGVDSSEQGIRTARRTYQHARCRFEVASLYAQGLEEIVGSQFDCVVALEVIEHLFLPKRLFEVGHSVLRKAGRLMLSTPYHGYAKNLTISLLNGWDRHFSVDWDGGHIKFFSKSTLATMAGRSGFECVRWRGVGRFPGLWKSMVLVAERR